MSFPLLLCFAGVYVGRGRPEVGGGGCREERELTPLRKVRWEIGG